jgi:LmbE family N-acetylglucosaminyl deacetylase
MNIINLLTTKLKKPLQIKNCETCLPKIREKFGRVLLAAVHQDDDVFIVSRLKQHLQIGDEIFVVWTTSAKRKGIKYEQKRINESKNAMKFLGIKPRNCFYLCYQERQTFRYMGEIITHIKKIIKQIQPGLVYIPA